jgi:subtilisin family serine protease
MTMKNTLFTLILVFAVAFSVTGVSAKQDVKVLDPAALYTTDMVDALLYEGLEEPGITATSLPTVQPFWADLVNTELVPNKGEGVYVAVLDTGLLDLWPFFFSQANIAWELGKGFTHDIWWDDVLEDIAIGDLKDDRGFITGLASGHGTHVASTVVGFNVNNLYWVKGIAPKATIIPVLVLDAWEVPSPYGNLRLSGGTDEMVSAGIMYIADLAGSLDGPVVINMSLGGPGRSAMIEAAVDYAISKGVIVVASAGNSGYDGMGYPGGLPQVISTGAGGWAEMFLNGWTADVPEALNTEDQLGNNWQIYLEDFSSRPNKTLDQKSFHLDVTAPGAWVVGPYRPAFATGAGYYYVSGTSMSAPHVSGMAGLLLQSRPYMKQAEMEFTLKLAAQGLPLPANLSIVAFPFEAPYYYTASWLGGDYGAGFLQADAVFKAARIKIK